MTIEQLKDHRRDLDKEYTFRFVNARSTGELVDALRILEKKKETECQIEAIEELTPTGENDGK